MSNFVQVSSHCNTFLGIDLHTTAATYAAIDATSDTLKKVTVHGVKASLMVQFSKFLLSSKGYFDDFPDFFKVLG